MRIPGVRQKVGGIPVTRTAGKYCSGGAPFQRHTRAHTQSDALTLSHTHTHARTCAHAKDAESLSSGCGACSLVSGQLQRVDRPGESLQGITARQPTLVSFSSKSPYEYFTPISASTSQ